MRLRFILPFLVLFMAGCSDAEESNPSQPAGEKIDHLPQSVDIIVEDGIPWDKKKTCVLILNNGDSIEGKIKCRGGISSKYYKHSFSLKLNQDTSLFSHFHKDDDLIINAAYIDKSLLRHQLSYEIFQWMDPENIAPNSQLQHLYLNGQYEGLYVFMEEVDKSLVHLSKEDPQAILVKDGGLFIENKDNFYVQEGEDYYQTKYPKVPTNLSQKSLDDLHDFIFNSSDQLFIEKVSDYFDIRNVMDWHLLLLITNNGDGVIKNFYWFKDSLRKWQVVPWDYDDSFGRNGDNSLQTAESGWERNILLKRLFELSPGGYRDLLINKWKTLRSSIITEKVVLSRIDQHVIEMKMIQFSPNFEKWPVTDSNYVDNFNFEEEIQLIKEYVPKRWKIIDSLVASWETL